MKKTLQFNLLFVLLFTGSALAQEPGFKSLFNGKDLTGWNGNTDLWSAKDGTITGVTRADPKLTHNTFLVYTNGDVSDFELRLSYRIVNGNSGIQYRSKVLRQGQFGPIVGGYQADFEAGKTYSGILYEEQGRGILAQRGQKTVIKPDPDDAKKHKVDVVGALGKSEDIQAKIKNEDWNDYVVVAKGNHLQHFINGMPTADVVDEQETKAAKSGILALQIHVGPPMTVQFRDIRLKELSGSATKRSDLELLQGDWRAVELVAGGQALDDDALAAIRVTFKGNDYSFETKKSSGQGSFQLTESTNPKRMDIRNSEGKEFLAIYEISDQQFKACYAVNGAARPTEFKSTESSDHVFAMYKRKND